jgi:hypothetical protein
MLSQNGNVSVGLDSDKDHRQSAVRDERKKLGKKRLMSDWG